VTVRGYQLAFDWSRSGGYGGTLEDVSGHVTADTDITVTVGRDTSQAASQIPAGTLVFELEDQALNFAPDKSTSPIYGDVVPGTPAIFSATVAGATTTLFAGDLDEFDYDPNGRTLSGTVIDAWGTPGGEQLSTPVYQGLRTGDLIGVILDAVGWPPTARDLDPGATVVAYWWAEGTDAATAVQELVDSEGPPAIAYVDGGTFVFRDRHHRLLRSASQTSQGTYTHIYPEGTGPGGDFKVLRDSFGYNHGMANIVNSATFEVDVRLPAAQEQVWSTDSAIGIPAGTTTTIIAQASDPFVNAITPTQALAYDDSGQPDGDYVLLSGSLAAVSIDRTSGQSLQITLTAGGTDVVLASLAVRAAPLTVARTVKVTYETAGLAAKDRKGWDRSLPWCNEYDALAIAQRIVSTYATARPVLTFTVDGLISAAYLQEFANRRISDRITVRNDVLGVNGPYMIERVTRTVKALGAAGAQLTITCEPPEPVQASNAFTFDVAGKGFDQGAFAADGIDSPATMFRFDVAGQGFDQGRFSS
jgi:hypothetical protein